MSTVAQRCSVVHCKGLSPKCANLFSFRQASTMLLGALVHAPINTLSSQLGRKRLCAQVALLRFP